MSTFKITFAGGAQIPTGSNFLIEFGGKKILIDCGLVQGEKYSIPMNEAPFTYDTKSIDALFVTHAHLDHVGRIPKLVKDGFKGRIISTAPTRDIGELVMMDSQGVLELEAKYHGTTPIYEEKDVLKAVTLWKEVVEYEKPFTFKTDDGDATFIFHDAGHILGSSIIEIRYKDKKIAFSGDLGNTPSPLLPDTTLVTGLDYLFVESVYGDRNHKDRDNRVELLKEYVTKVINRGGTVLIPAFSIERTQEMLQAFNNLIENKTIPQIPIYLDSPLGIKVTDVYKKYDKWFKPEVEKLIKGGDDIFSFPGLHKTISADESREINNDHRPKIIIAGSGMSNGGRIVYHEVKYLPDPNSGIIIVGYQAANTLGRRLIDNAKFLFMHGNKVDVKAEVFNIRGFSAHKDSDNLIKFVGASKETLKKVFVILGEPKSSYFMAQRIIEELDLKAKVPEKDEVIEID